MQNRLIRGAAVSNSHSIVRASVGVQWKFWELGRSVPSDLELLDARAQKAMVNECPAPAFASSDSIESPGGLES